MKGIDVFTYKYELIVQIVSRGQSIPKAIGDSQEGIGIRRMVRKFKWPWQEADTHRRIIIYLCPGVYTQSFTVPRYFTVVGLGKDETETVIRNSRIEIKDNGEVEVTKPQS